MIGIVPVLSRIPSHPRLDAEREQKLADEIRVFLCDPPKDPTAALDVPSVLMLHADESLAYHEALQVGGKRTLDDSLLLRDYLLLFAQIIPSNLVEPHLDRLIEATTKDNLLDNPDRVQSDLEVLASYCSHPAAYLALLKFYRLRKAAITTILRTAVRFWQLSNCASHPLLQAVLRDHYQSDVFLSDKSIPSLGAFALAVWESAPEHDPDVGLRIADRALRFNQMKTAANVLAKIPH